MKILHLLDEPYDSGLTSSALYLTALLTGRGVNCGVACREGSFAWEQAGTLGTARLGLKGPKIFWLPKVLRWIESQGWDILHAHTGFTHTLAWMIKRRLPRLALVRTRSDARGARRRMFYPKILKDTDFVLFPTNSMREKFLIAYNYPLSRAQVIYPAIGEGKMGPGMEGNDPIHSKVALVGRLDPIKGHEDFLRAIALLGGRFPEVSFEIIGAEKNVKADDLIRLARRLGIVARVHLRGYLDADDLKMAMSQSLFGVIASRGSEVISRVGLEWMSLGKALVSTSVGMMSELVADGKTGFLVPPRSHEEMSYRIKRLLESRELAGQMGQRAREVYLEKFDSSVCLEKHLTCYQKAFRAPATAHP